MKKNVLIFFQKNTGWILSFISVCIIIFTFMLKFVKYVYSRIYFDYFGINYNLFDIKELDFLYNFSSSIVFFVFIAMLLYLSHDIVQIINRKKRKTNTLIIDIVLVIFLNIFILYLFGRSLNLSSLVIDFVLFVVIEVLMAISLVRREKKLENQSIVEIKDYINSLLKILFFYICLLFVFLFFSYYNVLKKNKVYDVINNNKVIVYSTNDYYVLLNCEIDDNKIIIYKGEQTKIINDNIEVKQITFDSVIMK